MWQLFAIVKGDPVRHRLGNQTEQHRGEKKMNKRIPAGRTDLHNHTTASDGLLTPTQLVEFAAQRGLKAIAITDHDTTDGIEEGQKAGHTFHVTVVPGIELNTQMDRKEIHILGYFIDRTSPVLQRRLTELKEDRKIRAGKMVNRLISLYGFDITCEDVLRQAGKGGVGRPHIGRALMEKGIVRDVSEAFKKYLGTDCPAYVDRTPLSPAEGIELIEKAGGVPVLAHPGLLPDQGLLEPLCKMGIKGIEAYHTKHTQEDSLRYSRFAQAHGLLITGGSDCHGELHNGIPSVGDVTVDTGVVEALKSLSVTDSVL